MRMKANSLRETQPGEVLRNEHQAREQLGIGHTKYWSLIGDGALKVVRLGKRCTRVTQSSIDRLAEHGVPAKEAA